MTENAPSFDEVETVMELDPTFQSFAQNSRYIAAAPKEIDMKKARRMCVTYGRRISRGSPLGYKNLQLLLGFYYNTPDGTLPIFWAEDERCRWVPMFKRYLKF